MNNKEENVRVVEVGSIIGTPSIRKAFGDSAIVKPSCGGKKGNWYCITCDCGFTNQFNKDTHISQGTHLLVWICPEHGLETQ